MGVSILKSFKRLYMEFNPLNFMFFYSIIKTVMPTKTMSLDVGKNTANFYNYWRLKTVTV